MIKEEVSGYIKSTLNKPTSSAKLKTLLVDLVYYGEACQVYQNYKTDNLLTDILTDEQKALRSTADLNLTNIKNASYETCYFCMNVDIPLTKDEWHKLTFRIKRGKNYKDYKFLKQQVQEENI